MATATILDLIFKLMKNAFKTLLFIQFTMLTNLCDDEQSLFCKKVAITKKLKYREANVSFSIPTPTLVAHELSSQSTAQRSPISSFVLDTSIPNGFNRQIRLYPTVSTVSYQSLLHEFQSLLLKLSVTSENQNNIVKNGQVFGPLLYFPSLQTKFQPTTDVPKQFLFPRNFDV